MQLKKLIDAIKRRFKIRNEEAGSLIGVGCVILLLAALNLYVYINSSPGIIIRLTIPLGLAAILLFLLKNTVLAFLLALALSCCIFPEVPGQKFFVFIKDKLSYTVLAMLVIGGFLKVLNNSAGYTQLNIGIRKICKTLRQRKIAGICTTVFNCFSSSATVAAMHLLFKQDLESGDTDDAEKESLIRIMLMFSNLSCALIGVSLWWLFFQKFSIGETGYSDFCRSVWFYMHGFSFETLTQDFNSFCNSLWWLYFPSLPTSLKQDNIVITYWNVIKYVWYPVVVILYWLVYRIWKSDSENSVQEQRKFNVTQFIFLFGVPVTAIIVTIVYYGFYLQADNGLFNKDTFVLGAFSIGSFVLLILLICFRISETHFKPHETSQIISQMDNAQQAAGKLHDEWRTGSDHKTGRGFLEDEQTAEGFFSTLTAKRLNLSTDDRKYLEELEMYYKYDCSASATKYFRFVLHCFRHLADSAGNFYTTFTAGAKEMAGPVLVLIAALALKDIMATKGDYLYPSAQECDIMMQMFAVPDEFLPLAFMFLATVIGLIIGTSWGVFAVMFPFVLVVAKGGQLEPELLNMIFGAIISASVFINQSSKQADNVIVTSQLTGMGTEKVLQITKTDRWTCFGITVLGYLVLCTWSYIF